MKKKFTLVLSLLLMAGMVYDYNYRMAHTNGSGAPAGHTGSPGDGQTCARSGCHNGPTAANEVMLLTSDIPGSGYVAGTTYNMTFTMTNQIGVKFGFQLSAQDNAGNGVGTLIAGSGNQIVSSKYLTHTGAGTSVTGGTRTWNFQWTAPAGGSGSVTFYYSGNFTGSPSGPAGDVIASGSTSFNEQSVGITEAQVAQLAVYPNPVVDEIHVAARDVDEEIMISMFDVQGRKVLEERFDGGDIKIDVKSRSLNSGIYFMQIEVDGKTNVRKLLIN